MKGNCFEIGTIQAFLDGETTPDVSLRLTDHVADCDNCARLMADAEEESSIVFATLERELNTLVPTQRLWLRINETIEVERSRMPVWQKALAFIRSGLLSPSLAAAAVIVLFVGIVAVINLRTPDELVSSPLSPAPAPSSQNVSVPVNTLGGDMQIPSGGTVASAKPFGESKLSEKDLGRLVQTVNAKSSQRQITPRTADFRVPGSAGNDVYLPGEENYVRTIADIKQNVDTQKDSVMTPSNRVSFERDMAVVNDSINRMRKVVAKNPKNQAARQVLYSSYQDKIDLLNSVAQREELMASLR